MVKHWIESFLKTTSLENLHVIVGQDEDALRARMKLLCVLIALLLREQTGRAGRDSESE